MKMSQNVTTNAIGRLMTSKKSNSTRMKRHLAVPLGLGISLVMTLSGCSGTTTDTEMSPTSSSNILSAEDRVSIIQDDGELKDVYAEDQLASITVDQKNGLLLPIADKGWHELNMLSESTKRGDTRIPFRVKSADCGLKSVPVALRSDDQTLANVDVPVPINAEIEGNGGHNSFTDGANIRLCLVQYDIANSSPEDVTWQADLSLKTITAAGEDKTAASLKYSSVIVDNSPFKFVNETSPFDRFFIVPREVDDPFIKASNDATEGWFPASGDTQIYSNKTMYRQWQIFAYDADNEAPVWISQSLKGTDNSNNPASLATELSSPNLSAIHDMTDPKTVYFTLPAKDSSVPSAAATETRDDQWIGWASSIAETSVSLPNELDELGCNNPGSSWTAECIVKLNGLYDAMSRAVGGVTGSYEMFGTPETAAIDESAKVARNAATYSVGIVSDGLEAGCLSQNSPQREIPRAKDGQLVPCYMFFTTMYGHQYAEAIQAIATAKG